MGASRALASRAPYWALFVPPPHWRQLNSSNCTLKTTLSFCYPLSHGNKMRTHTGTPTPQTLQREHFLCRTRETAPGATSSAHPTCNTISTHLVHFRSISSSVFWLRGLSACFEGGLSRNSSFQFKFPKIFWFFSPHGRDRGPPLEKIWHLIPARGLNLLEQAWAASCASGAAYKHKAH